MHEYIYIFFATYISYLKKQTLKSEQKSSRFLTSFLLLIPPWGLAACSAISQSKLSCRYDFLDCVYIKGSWYWTQFLIWLSKHLSGFQLLQASLSHLTGFFKSYEVIAKCATRRSLPGSPSSLESPQLGAQFTGSAFALAVSSLMSALWALDPGEPGTLAPLSQAMLELVPSVSYWERGRQQRWVPGLTLSTPTVMAKTSSPPTVELHSFNSLSPLAAKRLKAKVSCTSSNMDIWILPLISIFPSQCFTLIFPIFTSLHPFLLWMSFPSILSSECLLCAKHCSRG